MRDIEVSKAGEFTGRHMLLAMVAFFGVIIGVNVLMAVVSSTTWTGLVVANSYVASQEFQDKEDAARRQRALGWTPVLTVADGEVRLAVTDGTGHPVELGEVSLLVHRPVGGHDDQTLTLSRDPDGAYVAKLTLARGVWDVVVTAPASAEGPFELDERITVEAGAP
jgi:nitrogen fixation protein FixH